MKKILIRLLRQGGTPLWDGYLLLSTACIGWAQSYCDKLWLFVSSISRCHAAVKSTIQWVFGRMLDALYSLGLYGLQGAVAARLRFALGILRGHLAMTTCAQLLLDLHSLADPHVQQQEQCCLFSF